MLSVLLSKLWPSESLSLSKNKTIEWMQFKKIFHPKGVSQFQNKIKFLPKVHPDREKSHIDKTKKSRNIKREGPSWQRVRKEFLHSIFFLEGRVTTSSSKKQLTKAFQKYFFVECVCQKMFLRWWSQDKWKFHLVNGNREKSFLALLILAKWDI